MFYMVRACLHRGYLLKEFNETYITLIPEKKNPLKIHDFRPINLCNVAYKFISKLMANRLREFLIKLFSTTECVCS